MAPPPADPPRPIGPGWEVAATDEGSGTPLVLLHAFPTDRRVFSGLIGRLDARLIAPDLPGFGETRLGADPPPILSVDILADAFADWIAGLGVGPVVLGGNAIGGYVALEIADRRPDLVTALVLMACKPAADPPERAADRESVARLALEAGSVVVAERLAAGPLGPDPDEHLLAIVRRMIEEADPRAIAALVRGLAARPDPVPALERLERPLLVIAGEQDPFSHREDVEALAAMVPGTRLVTIPGAGHLPALERPAEVAAAIDELVAAIAP